MSIFVKMAVLVSGMILSGVTLASPNPFTLVITIGGLDKTTKQPRVCVLDSPKQQALRTVFSDPYRVISESTRDELSQSFHIMPQIPSVSIKVRFDGDANTDSMAATNDYVTLFEDYESISYRPRTELLAIMRVAVRLCGINYTAFDLPTKD